MRDRFRAALQSLSARFIIDASDNVTAYVTQSGNERDTAAALYHSSRAARPAFPLPCIPLTMARPAPGRRRAGRSRIFSRSVRISPRPAPRSIRTASRPRTSSSSPLQPSATCSAWRNGSRGWRALQSAGALLNRALRHFGGIRARARRRRIGQQEPEFLRLHPRAYCTPETVLMESSDDRLCDRG